MLRKDGFIQSCSHQQSSFVTHLAHILCLDERRPDGRNQNEKNVNEIKSTKCLLYGSLILYYCSYLPTQVQ
jgi:hypothetical protein